MVAVGFLPAQLGGDSRLGWERFRRWARSRISSSTLPDRPDAGPFPVLASDLKRNSLRTPRLPHSCASASHVRRIPALHPD